MLFLLARFLLQDLGYLKRYGENLKIIKIMILSGVGPDQLLMECDLPEGTWPYKGNASVKMDVASGGGETYVKTHFKDVSYTVVKC